MDAAELRALRKELHDDLVSFVRFFDIGGVDHTHGGFCCGLTHTGERLTGLKFVWFNGRGIWVYSKLHNEGLLRDEKAPRGREPMQKYLLDVANRARDFAVVHGRDANGGWVIEMDERGKVLEPADHFIPTSGYGLAFNGEGLTEHYLATGDLASLDLAVSLLRQFVKMMDDPSRRGDVGPWPTSYPGLRTLGHHMICLNYSRQLLIAVDAAARRGVGALPSAGATVPSVQKELRALLDRMIEAILGPFLHPEHRLLIEVVDHQYKRPRDGNDDLCYLGHAIETLWMLMSEAERREDEALYARAASLFRRHVEAAWDPLHGGVFRGVRMAEWKYLVDGDCKVKWAQDEVCVGLMMLLAHPPRPDCAEEHGGESTTAWAARSMRRVRAFLNKEFRLAAQGVGSWKVGGDRKVKPDPGPGGISGYNMGCKSLPNRVEHYHTPRSLILCIRACEAALGGKRLTATLSAPAPAVAAQAKATSAPTVVTAASLRMAHLATSLGSSTTKSSVSIWRDGAAPTATSGSPGEASATSAVQIS
jgi:N-acylglucosamine 2-epimerase